MRVFHDTLCKQRSYLPMLNIPSLNVLSIFFSLSQGPCGMLIVACFYSFLICFAYFYYVETTVGISHSGSAMFIPRGPASCPFPRCYPHLLKRTYPPRNETFQRHRQQLLVPISVPDHRVSTRYSNIL